MPISKIWNFVRQYYLLTRYARLGARGSTTKEFAVRSRLQMFLPPRRSSVQRPLGLLHLPMTVCVSLSPAPGKVKVLYSNHN
jgi:hypothetical protein